MPNTPVTRLLAPWLTISRRLGLQTVAKIGEQERNARIVQVVERERNHFFGARAWRPVRHGVVVGIEIAHVACSRSNASGGRRSRGWRCSETDRRIAVRRGRPDRSAQSTAALRWACRIGQRQGLKDQAVEFGALAKQLPVVATRLLKLAGPLVVILRQLLLANQAAESMGGEAEARVDFAELAVGQYRNAVGIAIRDCPKWREPGTLAACYSRSNCRDRCGWWIGWRRPADRIPAPAVRR